MRLCEEDCGSSGGVPDFVKPGWGGLGLLITQQTDLCDVKRDRQPHI